MERKVVLVTGAGRGIGASIALNFAKEGYDVVVNYRSSEKEALEVVSKCEEYNVKAVAIKANVSSYEESKLLIDEALKVFGHIDCLVNNSGITKDNLILRMSEEEFDSVIDVNLKGCFNCCKHISKVMMKQRSGSIINMSSVIGQIGNVGQVNYAASKAGVIGLTKSLAKELASRNITVNAIAPGFIKTQMSAKLSDNVKETILSNIPLKRFGEVEDVANLVVFLANQTYISGQVINVDGGMVM